MSSIQSYIEIVRNCYRNRNIARDFLEARKIQRNL